MLALALLSLFCVAVALARWLGARTGIAPRTCCSARAWPPDDLTGRDRPSP